jgi:hypothetical protein
MTVNPLSAATWRSAWYLLAYQFVGWVLFSVALTAAVGAGMLTVTIAGIPLLIAASAVIRGCANVERARVRTILPGRVVGGYRASGRPGLVANATGRWKDPATWRDVAYLVGMFAPLMIFGGVVLVVWVVCLAGVLLPAYYWAPVQHYAHGVTAHGIQLGYFPNGPHGPGGWGVYIDTLPKALVAMVIFAVLFTLTSYALVATARLHARVARSLLRTPEDPLAPARDVLSRPGPLFSHNER